jgi:hypothetical protein
MVLSTLIVDDDFVGLPLIERSISDLSVEEAAALETDSSAELSRLNTFGFRRGASATWSNGNDVVQITLFELGSPDLARRLVADRQHGLVAATASLDDSNGILTYAVTESASSGDECAFVAHVCVRSVGNVCLQILMGFDEGSEGRADRVSASIRRLAIVQEQRVREMLST